MGFVEDMLKGNLATNLAIGIAAAVIGPAVIPVVARTAKPLTKAAIKGGLRLCEAGRAGLSCAAECLSGLISDAKSEMEGKKKDRVNGLEHTPPPCGPGTVPESPL